MHTTVIDTQVRYIELQGVRENKDSKFPDNCIITSKYTLLNFLPRNTLQQFFNPSKLWFLFISVIEVVGKSDITYSYGTLIPLLLLLFLQITRDGLKEYHSHIADRNMNYRTYPVWDGSKFILKCCKDILVGDIVLLVNNDIVPADLVLIGVGNDEHHCYVDASDIIGERSLKIKNPVRETQNIINTIELETASSKLVELNDNLFVSQPNKAFKHFAGKVKLLIAPTSSEIGLRNMLLRDMRVINTPWIFGIVAYTGIDTKIWINNLARPKKVSELTKIMEKWLLWSFLVIFVISTVNTIVFQFYSVGQYQWYDVFLGNLLLFNHIVPISLALVVELIKIFLNRLISQRDPNIKLNSPDLCSNLGMVEYVITDKTGTLTENRLKVALCVVGNQLYVDSNEVTDSENSDRIGSEEGLAQVNRILSNYPGEVYSFTDLQVDVLNKQETREFMHYFYCIALCNLAFPQDDEYIALSEDDKALAQAAASFGFKVIARDEDSCVIEIFGEEVMFYVLGTQAFSSVNKKSRIIVKQSGASEVFMYLKGTKRAMQSIFEENQPFDEYAQVIVEYRSLYLAYKLLNRREVKQFMFEYGNAKLSLVNKEGRVESVFEKFDKNATFLGIVGLEDRVTEDTRQAISCLKSAGIKFWLLSGDSEDSTVTSALASGIIPHEAKILRLVDLTSELDCLNYLETYTKEYIFPVYAPAKDSSENIVVNIRAVKSDMNFSPTHSPVFNQEDIFQRGGARVPTQVARNPKRRSSVHPVISKLSIYKHLTSLQGQYDPKDMNFALSVDSKSFEFCLETVIHMKYFVFLLFTAKAVCFHNLSPDQKSKIIRLISSNLRFNPLVLAIGDSISEVGMIQQAHIGVGIKGTDAANNADVVIKKFGDLQNLLLIHGHKQYIQMSKMILLSIYAMALLEFQLAFYNIISGWDGSSILNKNFLLVYKLIISILPIAGLCLLDKDNSSTTITPQAYKVGIFNRLLTVKYLVYYILTALLQSLCTFVFSLLFFPDISAEGATENQLLLDISIFLVISSTVFLSIVVETYSLSLKTLMIYTFSVGLQIAVILPLGYYDSELMGYPQMLAKFRICWVYIVPTSAFNVGITYCFKAMRFAFFPDILEKVRGESPASSLESETRLKQFRNEINNVFRESAEFNHKKSYNESKLNVWTMRFTSKYMERAYQEDKYTENLKSFRMHLVVAALFIFIYSLTVLLEHMSSTVVIIYICIFCTVLLLAGLLPWINSFRDFAVVYIIAYFIAIQVYLMLLQILFKIYSVSLVVILPVIGFIGFSNYWIYMTVSQFICTTFVTINAAYYFSDLSIPTSQVIISTISYTIVYLILFAISSIISYNIDKSKREEFLLVQTVQLEMQKNKSVLNYLLPAFVRKRVKDGVRFISENQGVVSIIFCDICNFESILKDYNSTELTILLDEIFGRFDQICIESGCTKIETVGKTYMACAGLKEPELELDPYYNTVPHARRCVEMALSLLESTESIYLKNGENLSLYIGINSGPVTAGVVGYHKPQFSLVGDTVNTSSRMASLCPGPNTVQISMKTHSLIGNTVGLILTPHSVVAKGKGRLDTFLVSAPEQPTDVSALSVKHGPSLSPSLTEMFSFKSGSRSNKIRKVTLSKFSYQHADHDRRRSSLISILESEVTVDNEYLRKETEMIEKVKWISLSCKETEKEKEFRLETSKTTYPIALSSLLLRLLCDVLLLIIMTVNIVITGDFSKLYEEIRLILEAVLTTVLAVQLSKHFKNPWFSWLLGFVYFAGGISKLGDESSVKDLVFIEYVLHMVQTAHCSQLFFKNFIVIGSLSYLSYIIYASASQFREFPIQIIADTVCFVIILYTIYNRESGLRYYSVVTVAARKELKKTKELLEEMMPKHVFEILKEQNSVTEKINNVSILYADIVGFTLWSSDKTPQQVVDMLSKLFTEFDRKCKKRKVYKVHTIGDCYVAMGYRDTGNRNPTEECLQMALFALDLVKIIRKVNDKEGIDPRLDMRIGLHTGDIIGGITGTSIVRYDIYGIDVIIANKMESTGTAGRVKISQNTMKILMDNYPDRFLFKLDTEKPPVDIDKQKIHSYYLETNPEYPIQSRATFSFDYE